MRLFIGTAAAFALSALSAGAATLDLTEGGTENAGAILVEEQKGVEFNGDVIVDYVVGTNVAAGGSQFTGINNFSGGLSLEAGTYDSYLLHFDPIGASGGTSSGQFSFASDIVALIVSNGSGSNGGTSPTAQLLNASDDVFGLADADYETALSRRSEGGADVNGDFFRLVDANTLDFSFKTTSRFVDNVRVITEAVPGSIDTPPAVPVPASLPLLLAGLGGMAFMKRRRRS